MKLPALVLFTTGLALASTSGTAALPLVDLSSDAARQVVVARGTETIYQGHPTTLLLPDGQTMFCVWTLGHGGTCGPMKRSEDGGRSWSELLATPENWTRVKNCPALYRLADPQGVARLFVFAGRGADGKMQQAHSTDEGRMWTPMAGNGLECVMPFCTIVPVEGGRRLIGLTSIRRSGEQEDARSNIVTQSESTDGGLTWSAWRVLLDLGEMKPCEPALVRSPDGRQLLCLLRENVRAAGSHRMTSDDEGRTWSPVAPLPPGLWGDRHMPRYAADGRLVVSFRDMGPDKRTHQHFVAWVGKYEDLVAGRDGQYKIKLLHSHAGSDCGYSGLERLPDGTLVATTYIQYRPGAEKQSVVSTRFQLAEADRLVQQAISTAPAEPTAAPRVAGILLDDAAAEFTGKWVASTKQQALVGPSYRHDDRQTATELTAKFTPEIPEDGRYEVRLLYVATSNRASNAPVAIHSAEGQQTVFVNQKQECLVQGVPRALGTFLFKAGRQGSVLISNAHADGFVVVDGVQFVPEAIAKAERATHADAGFPVRGESKLESSEDRELPERRARMAAAVAVSPLAEKTLPGRTAPPSPEPVRLAKDTPAADVDGKSYDLVVVGGTGCGVMCAVRAAREGLTVLLVQHNRHLGGMMANGLMQWDALYGGPRAPLFTELLRNIEKDAIARFGENSRDHQTLRYTHEHYPIGWAEPHVAEREFNRLVAGEKNVIVLLEHYPVAVERDGALLRSVKLREYSGSRTITVRGAAFADATYEGDLFALARVPYRVGREARDEYGEPHAGKVFTNIDSTPAPREAVAAKLNIRPYGSRQGSVDPASPFTADGAVQAYNYRFCVTRDPANRVLLTAPPPGYDREEFVHYGRKSIATNAGPNLKSHMNSPILPGENHAYPEADWPAREKIIERHKNFALGLIWFLQNDEATPEKKRAEFREWGLPRDEFADNKHLPYEMYVREARRIVGRHVFTEHDNSLASGLARTPIFPDSIAITDWYMDSHSCTTDARPGFHYDGKLILTEESRPAQIPYRALLPQGVDNLLVPAGLSATHVTWGAVRLEPVWMQTGEAAGLAIALAAREKIAPAKLDPDRLVRTLAERRQLVSFFNDVKVDAPEPWIPAVQYFGTKGFFASYDARPAAPLAAAVAHQWVRAFAALLAGRLDATAEAAKLHAVETAEGPATTTGALTELLAAAQVPPALAARIVAALPATPDTPLARGAACEALFAAGIR